ncbi:hypothetical protein Nepgr_014011 [Nepenthes gracilis]|uniref:Uncharacterized protein n=1 Tax=Nepenthes gracilis TaxID=150966 RepID=A0AAD3SIG2_NEPGR|nr:hypothetical protein Nepgr_014011 [Nepenthes gracilis]
MLRESPSKLLKFRVPMNSKKRERVEFMSSSKSDGSNSRKTGKRARQNGSNRPTQSIKDRHSGPSSAAELKVETKSGAISRDQRSNDEDRGILQTVSRSSAQPERKICRQYAICEGSNEKLRRKRSVRRVIKRAINNDFKPTQEHSEQSSGSNSTFITDLLSLRWIGRRPQRTSRSRRANVVSPIFNQVEVQKLSSTFSANSFHHLGEKLETLPEAMPLQNLRPGCRKNRSNPRRPPSKKLSDRKAFPHAEKIPTSVSANNAAIVYDDHEELVAAASAAQKSKCITLFPASPHYPSYDYLMWAYRSYVFHPHWPKLELTSRKGLSLAFIQMKHRENFVKNSNNSSSEKLRAAKKPEDDVTTGLDVGTKSINSYPLLQIVLSALIPDDESKGMSHGSEEASTSPQCATDEDCHGDDGWYELMCVDDKLAMELKSIGLYRDTMPDLAEKDELIDQEIMKLKELLHQQIVKKKTRLKKIEQAIAVDKERNKKDMEQAAMDRLVEMAHKRQMVGKRSDGSKKLHKVTKKAAAGFVNRTVARCKKFELTGKSCFRKPALQKAIFSATKEKNDETSAHCAGSGAENNACLEAPSHLPKARGSYAENHGRRSMESVKAARKPEPAVPKRRKRKLVLIDDDDDSDGEATACNETALVSSGVNSSLEAAEAGGAVHLLLPQSGIAPIEEMGVVNGQEDLSSWFEVDELGDCDAIGLAIPMDDLSQLDMLL